LLVKSNKDYAKILRRYTVGTIQIKELHLEKETKNKVRYNDFSDFGAIYIPKEKFKGLIPQVIKIEISW
jgi:hypothetical protein